VDGGGRNSLKEQETDHCLSYQLQVASGGAFFLETPAGIFPQIHAKDASGSQERDNSGIMQLHYDEPGKII